MKLANQLNNKGHLYILLLGTLGVFMCSVIQVPCQTQEGRPCVSEPTDMRVEYGDFIIAGCRWM